jgi:hypothetical protein
MLLNCHEDLLVWVMNERRQRASGRSAAAGASRVGRGRSVELEAYGILTE